MTNQLVIPIDDAIRDFRNHLSWNSRTILSAKFGDGKTYFINKFQNEPDVKKQYTIIKLYPVNYQVVENVDIFDLVKRDILLQLIGQGIIPDEYEIPDNIALPLYVQYHVLEYVEEIPTIASSFFTSSFSQTMAPVIAAVIMKSSKLFKKLKKKYNEFKEAGTYENLIENFINKTDLTGIYEEDLITRLIQECIQEYRKKTNKEVILIFEDMDRIDPAHIFRIMNILSAQVEHSDKHGVQPIDDGMAGNKFGVDKIILVLDYNNLENIFKYRYGPGANFEGYISKFSNKGYFEYSLTEQKKQFIYKAIAEETKLPNKLVKQLIPIEPFLALDNLGISNKTMRDIVNSIDNTDSQIMQNGLELIKKYSIHPGIPKLIVVMKRLSIHKVQIIDILNRNLNAGNREFLAYIIPYFTLKEIDNPNLDDLYVNLSGYNSVKLSREFTAEGLMDCDKYLFATSPSNGISDKEPYLNWIFNLVCK